VVLLDGDSNVTCLVHQLYTSSVRLRTKTNRSRTWYSFPTIGLI